MKKFSMLTYQAIRGDREQMFYISNTKHYFAYDTEDDGVILIFPNKVTRDEWVIRYSSSSSIVQITSEEARKLVGAEMNNPYLEYDPYIGCWIAERR